VASADSVFPEVPIPVPMNQKDAAQFKKLMLARRAGLARGVTPSSQDDPPTVDEAVLAPASPTPLPPNAPARALLHALDAALARIEAGAYGVCTGCGGEIGTRRLVAFPWATSCLACQARAEKQS